MVIDPGTETGAKVDARLRDELVAWLVTVAADGTPVPTPVWFWWDGETLLVYSQPDKPKLRHIAANPRVAIAMRTDEHGDALVPQAGHFLHSELPALLAVYEHFFAGGNPTLEMITEEESLLAS